MKQQDLFGPEAPPAPVPMPPAAGASALLSPCGQYRYRLARWWGPGPRVGFLMLNPSVATAEVDDPTLRQCLGFARAWGFDGLEVANLFALRSPDPGALKRAADPVGPDNDAHLSEFLYQASKIVLAWGNHGSLRGRDQAVLALLKARGVPLLCLRVSKQGQPEHPLYKPLSLQPIPFARGAS